MSNKAKINKILLGKLTKGTARTLDSIERYTPEYYGLHGDAIQPRSLTCRALYALLCLVDMSHSFHVL